MRKLSFKKLENTTGGSYAGCAGALAAAVGSGIPGTDEMQILYNMWKSTAVGASCYMF